MPKLQHLLHAVAGDPNADPDDALVNYVTGEAKVPLPTYVLGGYGGTGRVVKSHFEVLIQ